jgi:L-amino acid N-acyltransferase YncA
VLRTLGVDAQSFDLAGRPATAAALSDEQALRYLRDPSLRHWIAERREEVLGYLVAQVLRRHAGRPAMIVTGVGIRAEHRAGEVGPHLVAALCDEAARLGAGEVMALAGHRAVQALLRRSGFRRQPRRARLWHIPE